MVCLQSLIFRGELRPNLAPGTNAMGVAMVKLALITWRLWRRRVALVTELTFSVPRGLVGIYVGTRLGLAVPRHSLRLHLNLLLPVTAGRLTCISTRPTGGSGIIIGVAGDWSVSRAVCLDGVALLVGATADLFGIADRLMIVPPLAVFGCLDLMDTASTVLPPAMLSAAWVAVQCRTSGPIATGTSVARLPTGSGGPSAEAWLGGHLSRRTAQRDFAELLVVLGP